MDNVPPPVVYHFAGFTLDLRRGMLLADGAEQALRPKTFALLRHLLENADRLVSRDEIMQAVWPDLYVTDDSITQCIREIRRVLGDEAQSVVRTLPRRGYRLVVPVSRQDEARHDATHNDATNCDGADNDATDNAGTDDAGVVRAADSEVVPAPPTDRPMVIVLPFENIGGDADQGYFADGLTADLVTDLTRFQDMHIVTPLRFGHGPGVRGNDLPSGARYVLSGSVRRAGGRLRVTVRLGDARSGHSLWAERFDRPLEDLFSVQEDLTNQIAASVDGQVGREGLRRARRRPPANLDAYDLYLQGRELHGRTTEVDTRIARQMFDRAIAADPNYAPAYAYQAYTVLRGFTQGWGEPRGRTALAPSLDLAMRAVELEPESSLCMMRLAFVLSLMGRGEEAVETATRGVRANPCDASSRAGYGETLSMAGLHEPGVAALRLAMSLNPFHPPFWWGTLGRALVLAGRAQEALVELRRCATRAPDYRPCHSSMVVAYVETGQTEAARAAMREVLRLRPGWVLHDYDGVFGFQNEADTARFLDAFRVAGMPER